MVDRPSSNGSKQLVLRQEMSGAKYRSIKVTARTKLQLDFIAAACQKPLIQVLGELVEHEWEEQARIGLGLSLLLLWWLLIS